MTEQKLPDVKRTWIEPHYRGIGIEVCHWGAPRMNDGHGVWNFYVTLPESLFPEGDFDKHIWLPAQGADDKGRTFYDEYVWPFADMKFHGGITFYNKRGGLDGGGRWIKAGCDYNHAFDQEQGYGYDEFYVMSEAKECADHFHELFPSLLFRCSYNGKYYPRDQGSENERGQWMSLEGQEASRKWREKRATE